MICHNVVAKSIKKGRIVTETPKKRRNNYVNNRDLLNCIIEYREELFLAEAEGRAKPRIPDYAGKCLMLICQRMATRPNFSGYSYLSEMQDDAIENCLQAFDNFDPTKSNNPFGYFSRIGWRAMIRRIFEEKAEHYVKHKNSQRLHLLDEHYTSPGGYVNPRSRAGTSEISQDALAYSNQVIESFETILANRKKPKVDKKKT
jgi:hypothetical protein